MRSSSLRRSLVLFLSLPLFTSCLSADSDPIVEDAAAEATVRAAAMIELPPTSTTPVYQQPRYAETWTPSTTITWPSDATRMQVILRRGHAATFSTPATFYAFLISDGNRVRRALLVPTSQYNLFIEGLHLAFTIAETPNSERSHSIAGGLYVGPHPAGPPGDPFPTSYLGRILTAAAAIDQAAREAVAEPL